MAGTANFSQKTPLDAGGPVSRVLSRGRYACTSAPRWQPFISAEDCSYALMQPTRASRSETLLPPHPKNCWRETPMRSCSGWGLPCGVCRQTPGALLPHPFTLACEVALHRRFALCGTIPRLRPVDLRPAGVTRHPCFAEPGLSSMPCGNAAARPPGTVSDRPILP